MFKKCAWKYQRLHFLDLAIASLLSKQSSQLIAFLTDFSSGKWTRNADKLQNVSFFPPSSLPGCVSAGCVLSVLGQMVRGRSVVLRAAGEGRPCPEQLTQHRSCPVKPCYSWQLGPWSPCTVQVGISPELTPARGQRQNPSSVCEINGLEVCLWLVEVCREEGEVQEWWTPAPHLPTSSSHSWEVIQVEVLWAHGITVGDLWIECVWLGIVMVTYNLIT